MRDILPVVVGDLGLEAASHVYCSDASLDAQGINFAAAREYVTEELARREERRRFTQITVSGWGLRSQALTLGRWTSPSSHRVSKIRLFGATLHG